MTRAGRTGLAAIAIAGAVVAAALFGPGQRTSDQADNGGAGDSTPARVPAVRPFQPAPAPPGVIAAPGEAPNGSGPGESSGIAAQTLVDQLLALLGQGGPLSDDDRRALAAAQDRLLQLGAAALGPVARAIDAGTTRAGDRELLFHVLRQLPGQPAADRIAAVALADRQPALRAMAIESLAQIRTDQAMQTLATVARTDPELPARPLITAPRGPNDQSTQLPDERKFTPRMQAMAALATTKLPAARDVLLEILSSGQDESLRMEAARDLRGMNEDAQVAAGLQRAAASDPSTYVRLAALHSLAGTAGVSPGGAWLAALGRIATDDADAGVRALAQQLLDQLPPGQ